LGYILGHFLTNSSGHSDYIVKPLKNISFRKCDADHLVSKTPTNTIHSFLTLDCVALCKRLKSYTVAGLEPTICFESLFASLKDARMQAG
jgi:hypothetical protein